MIEEGLAPGWRINKSSPYTWEHYNDEGEIIVTCTSCNVRESSCYSSHIPCWDCNNGVPISHEEKFKNKLKCLESVKPKTIQTTLM